MNKDIVLERVLGFKERLFYSFTRSVDITLSFLLHLFSLSRLVVQTGMVLAERTPTIKSVSVDTRLL